MDAVQQHGEMVSGIKSQCFEWNCVLSCSNVDLNIHTNKYNQYIKLIKLQRTAYNLGS